MRFIANPLIRTGPDFNPHILTQSAYKLRGFEIFDYRFVCALIVFMCNINFIYIHIYVYLSMYIINDDQRSDMYEKYI